MIVFDYTTFRAVFAPGAPPDNAGWGTWPVSSVLPPPGEFGLDLTLPVDLTPLTLAITVNGGANDTTPGVDQYDWFLSQRTEDPARQPFAVETWNDANPGNTNTKSGSIVLNLQATQYADMTLTPPAIPAENLATVYRDVCVYVRRRSNGHIVFGHLLLSTEEDG